MSFIPNLPDVAVLKIFRVLRPLRSLKTIQGEILFFFFYKNVKGIRILVESLIDSVPAFTNVLFFLVFFIIFFGILGVQLFSGIFEQRCRLTPVPINGVWLVDEDYTRLCLKGSTSSLSCPAGYFFFIILSSYI